MPAKDFFVAGVKHHQLHTVLDEIQEGDGLELVPEPTNKFDPNAIKIMYGDVMVGYVPKTLSPEVASQLDMGEPMGCIVLELSKNAEPWKQLKVRVVNEDEVEEGDLEEEEEPDGFGF